MRPLLILLSLPLLASCATSPRLFKAGVAGNESFVAVSNVWNISDALPYATKHCAQYGKIPKAKGADGYTERFDCVTPDRP